VLDAVVVVIVVLLIVAGFWWTRGAGGVPGGTDDPAREELRKYDELGDRLPDPAEEMRDRHEIK
jgi:hypothetical protein